jgi:hypothetical protein
MDGKDEAKLILEAAGEELAEEPVLEASGEVRQMLLEKGVDPEKFPSLVESASKDRAETVRDVRHNKRAAQDLAKSDNQLEYARFMVQANRSLKRRQRGRRVMVNDWALALDAGDSNA